MYMWEQYQATGDKTMLAKYFPFMKATAQFLLAYQQVGTDGLRVTDLETAGNRAFALWATC